MDKEDKCEKQQCLCHMDGDGDAVSLSTDTSRWSPPSRLSCCSESPPDSSDCEDKAGALISRTADALPPVSGQGLKKSGVKSTEKDKKVNGPKKQNYWANQQKLKLPSIKPQVSKPKIQPDSLTSALELRNQVWDLQQQLSKARTENKLLKKLQHRHMVALQHFQDSEHSIPQIFKKHNDEVRALQGHLSETRTSRDNLARQLQASENKLLNTKAALQHLQLLSQDHSLLQREDLALRLAEATAQLETKDKRILYMEKNLELCQASFKRQIATEQRKINEERKLSCYLREQICHLNRKINDREKELGKHNIYSQRFLKGSDKKGRQNKMVQTDGLVFLPTDVAKLLEIEYSAAEERLAQQESTVSWMVNSNISCSTPVQTETLVIEKTEKETFANVTLEENQEETVMHADTSEDSCSEESPEHQNDGDCAEEKEASEVPQVLEEEQEKQHESTEACILEESLNSAEHKRKEYQLPKFRRKYVFKQSTEDLHNGRPVNSGVDATSCENSRSAAKVEILSSGISDLHLSGEKSKREIQERWCRRFSAGVNSSSTES